LADLFDFTHMLCGETQKLSSLGKISREIGFSLTIEDSSNQLAENGMQIILHQRVFQRWGNRQHRCQLSRLEPQMRAATTWQKLNAACAQRLSFFKHAEYCGKRLTHIHDNRFGSHHRLHSRH